MFEAVRKVGAGKLFAASLADITKGVKEAPPAVNIAAIDSIVPFLTRELIGDGIDANLWHNLTKQFLFYIRYPPISDICGDQMPCRSDGKFFKKLAQENANLNTKLSIRAAHTKEFLGVKITTEYQMFSKLAWINLVFQVARAMQATTIARIEDVFLPDKIQTNNLHTVYDSPVYSTLSLTRINVGIPVIQRVDNGESIYKIISYPQKIDSSASPLRATSVYPGVVSKSVLFWLFDLFIAKVREASSGTLEAKVLDNDVLGVRNTYGDAIKYVPKGFPKKGSRQGHFPPITKSDRDVFTAYGFSTRYALSPIKIAEALFEKEDMYSNSISLRSDENWRTTVAIDSPLFLRPVSVGVSIGLHRKPACVYSGKRLLVGGCDGSDISDNGFLLYPTIRVELRNRETKSASAMTSFGPPRLISITEVI